MTGARRGAKVPPIPLRPVRMHVFGHIVIAALLVVVFLLGFALFWIARQDDSRAGRLIGLIAMAGSAFALAWIAGGHRFF